MDLRCGTKLHGKVEDGWIEVKCDSRYCGAGPDVVVFHQFDLHTGEMKTLKYRNPRVKERKEDGATDHLTPLRAS